MALPIVLTVRAYGTSQEVLPLRSSPPPLNNPHPSAPPYDQLGRPSVSSLCSSLRDSHNKKNAISYIHLFWGGGAGEVDPRGWTTPDHNHGGGAERLVHLEAAQLGTADPRVLQRRVGRGEESGSTFRVEGRSTAGQMFRVCMYM